MGRGFSTHRPHRLILGLTWIAAFLVGALVSTGCSTVPLPETAQSLGDAEIAVALDPQSFGSASASGSVVLVGPGNTLRRVATEGIDTAALVWDSSGLAFSDRRQDSILGDRLASVERAGPQAIQTALFPGRHPGEYVAVFNVGFQPQGYQFDVTTFTASGSSTHPLWGMADAIARCDGQYVALIHRSPAETATHSLVRLPAGDLVSQETIGVAHRGIAIGGLNYRAPCVDGTLILLHAEDADLVDSTSPPPTGDPDSVRRPGYLTLVSASTGQQRTMKLTGPGGAPLAFPVGGMTQAQYSDSTIGAGTVTWVSGDGVAYRSDLKTGATREIASGLPRVGFDSAYYRFAGNYAYVLAGLGSPVGEVEVRIYRVNDWALLSRRTLPGLAGFQTDGVILRDFAVRPGHQP